MIKLQLDECYLTDHGSWHAPNLRTVSTGAVSRAVGPFLDVQYLTAAVPWSGCDDVASDASAALLSRINARTRTQKLPEGVQPLAGQAAGEPAELVLLRNLAGVARDVSLHMGRTARLPKAWTRAATEEGAALVRASLPVPGSGRRGATFGLGLGGVAQLTSPHLR